MTDNELILFDRLEVIRKTNEKYDLEHNAYISFSGGKDSTVLHYLMDEALPGNHIPRVFINTGIEYLAIVKFVREMAANDDRFEIVTPKVKIKEMLEKDGYPFKSKQHARWLGLYQKNGRTQSVKNYLGEGEKQLFRPCPEMLKYQFDDSFKIPVSDKCCLKMKEKPSEKWGKENKRKTSLTGIRKEEGGRRQTIPCMAIRGGKLNKFHPLSVVTEQWEEWYIKTRKIKLCELYYSPYNFERTGCKGCPFALHLQEELDTLALYLPAERKQCEYIWAPVYAEYRRLGYRLRKDDGQISLFEWANHVNDI